MPQSYTFSLEKQSRDENFIPQDAPFLTIGERNGIGDSSEYPDLDKGLHFCLFNNLWSTDFHLWQEGSIRYGFHIEGGQWHAVIRIPIEASCRNLRFSRKRLTKSKASTKYSLRRVNEGLTKG